MRRRWIVGMAVVLVAVLAVVGWRYVESRDRLEVGAAVGVLGPSGGEVWNDTGTVGVIVPAGGVSGIAHVTFAPVRADTPQSPLAELSAVVGAAVDITFDGAVSSAEVVIAFDQSAVPADAAQSGQPVPTIRNAGIEVFNDDIGAWIPLPTTIDEASGRIRATAPHFSWFRAAVSKIGSFVVDVADKAVTVVLDAAKTVWDTFHELTVGTVKVIFRNLTGTFDDSKYVCTPRDEQYSIAVADATRQGQLDACAVTDATAVC